jgi:hypothetical protein
VLLGLQHLRLEALLGEVALPFGVAQHVGRLRHSQRPAQPGHEPIDAGDGVGIGGRRVALQPAVGQHQQPVAHVVEDHQVIGQQEDEIGQIQLVAGRGRQPLHKAHPVVADVAHCAADEARQTVHVDRSALAHEVLDHIQWIGRRARLQDSAACALDAHRLAAGQQRQRRLHADEGVAAHLLPLLHRLQQKGGAVIAQLQIDRHRRLQVGRQLAVDRDQIALPGQGANLIESGFVHGGCPGRLVDW